MLTRDAILGFDDLPRQEVEVPEWGGGSVYVRALNGSERDQLERMIASDKVSRAAIVALCTVDAKGKQVFTKADVDKLTEKNGSALETIVNACLSHNLISADSLADAKKE